MKTNFLFFYILFTSLALASCKKENTIITTELKFISLTASEKNIYVGGSTTITAEVEGEGLVYSWSATAGDIIGSGKSVIYAASACCSGSNKITCSVTDAASNSAVNLITINVQ